MTIIWYLNLISSNKVRSKIQLKRGQCNVMGRNAVTTYTPAVLPDSSPTRHWRSWARCRGAWRRWGCRELQRGLEGLGRTKWCLRRTLQCTFWMLWSVWNHILEPERKYYLEAEIETKMTFCLLSKKTIFIGIFQKVPLFELGNMLKLKLIRYRQNDIVDTCPTWPNPLTQLVLMVVSTSQGEL